MRIPRTVLALPAVLVLSAARPGYAQRPDSVSAPKHQRVLQRLKEPDTAGDTTKKGKLKKKEKKTDVGVSGYVQVFYKGRRDANGDGAVEPGVFRVQRARIEFKGKVTEHASFDVEVDPRSPEITGVLRDGFIALDYVPRHEIRIGQQKTLFGFENTISSTRLFVVNRAEVSDNLSRGVTLRDIGVGLVGFVPLGGRFAFEDAITIVNGSGMNVQADETHRKNVWGRIGVRYQAGDFAVRVGGSAATGDQIAPADSGPPALPAFRFSFTRMGGDLEIDHPVAFVAAEYVTGDDKTPKALGDIGGGSTGWYALVAGKTKWRMGPIIRVDGFEEFHRVTWGAYFGMPADPVSLLLNYEVFKDDLGKHDDRYYARLQLRF